ESDVRRRAVLGGVLETNLARIEEGYETLGKHFKAGAHGLEFMQGFFTWTERTINEARTLLGKNNSRPKFQRYNFATSSNGHSKSGKLSHLLNAREPVVFAYNGGIGDRLCNLPALRALAALFPGRLALVCGKGDRNLYYSDLNLRAVYELDFDYAHVGFTFATEDLARHLVNCDLFLSINPWHTSSVSELLAKFPNLESVGFYPEFRHHLHCDYEGHAIDMAFAVPRFLNSELDVADFSQPPAISEPAKLMAQEFRRSYAGWKHILFVHTDTKKEKSWPRERFEGVLDRFLEEFPDVGALVVDVREEGIRQGRFPDRVLPLTLPLDACFALLRESDLFLGIDSCHLHAADLWRVPGVGLFGPTTSRRWGYKFSSSHRHLQCSGRMDEIAIEDVFDALRSIACSLQAN
ncbi:MAG TPA: glycosyltransferase family 9 protein, partial [Pyrinomonadaceae bacterium]|nr:glycosyltransferase family 9 protein [Pyrinomonadaceae bacterium]